MRYAIIHGTGRSGTNWLLDMFDASPQTHCRNEPHGIPGTPLNVFPRVWSSDAAGSVESYRGRWDQVAQSTSRRFGASDHHLTYAKDYLHPWSNRLGLSRAMTAPRARRLTSRVDRRLSGTEWELPGWLGSPRHLQDATAVLKIQIDAPLLAWLVTERPQVPVIQIVRHPGGRLSSWLNRLVGPMDAQQREALLVRRRERLVRIRAFHPEWERLVPDPASLSLVSAEVWLWRYVNESTMRAGEGHPSYRLVRFDNLAADPVGQAETLFDHVGLDWTDEIARRIRADSSTSVFGAVSDSRAKVDSWRTELDAADVRTVEEITAGSAILAALGS